MGWRTGRSRFPGKRPQLRPDVARLFVVRPWLQTLHATEHDWAASRIQATLLKAQPVYGSIV